MVVRLLLTGGGEHAGVEAAASTTGLEFLGLLG